MERDFEDVDCTSDLEGLICLSDILDNFLSANNIYCTKKFFENVIQKTFLDKLIEHEEQKKKFQEAEKIYYGDTYLEHEWFGIHGISREEYQRIQFILGEAFNFYQLENLKQDYYLNVFTMDYKDPVFQFKLGFKEEKFIFKLESEI